VSTKPIILIHTLLIHTVGIGRLQAIGEEFGEKKLTALAKANCGSAASELNSRVLAQVSSGRLAPWPCLLPPWDRK
jgi:hypothetical protein